MHDEISKNYDLEYCESALMCADIFTKAFPDKEKWRHACLLIAHVLPGDFSLFSRAHPAGGTIRGGVSLRNTRQKEARQAAKEAGLTPPPKRPMPDSVRKEANAAWRAKQELKSQAGRKPEPNKTALAAQNVSEDFWQEAKTAWIRRGSQPL